MIIVKIAVLAQKQRKRRSQNAAASVNVLDSLATKIGMSTMKMIYQSILRKEVLRYYTEIKLECSMVQ